MSRESDYSYVGTGRARFPSKDECAPFSISGRGSQQTQPALAILLFPTFSPSNLCPGTVAQPRSAQHLKVSSFLSHKPKLALSVPYPPPCTVLQICKMVLFPAPTSMSEIQTQCSTGQTPNFGEKLKFENQMRKFDKNSQPFGDVNVVGTTFPTSQCEELPGTHRTSLLSARIPATRE